ncbi:hypothetical protein NQ095_15845 [Rossellomorea sp. SC111]|uniref:hypothetical protein n=1 Tax=Rossellomorea sp. SC111 TaxID=2968985 RepID=UPI00215AE30C|nr:hypothetical protein [Rossellomorea sp. SC111]MCR8849891.1 hypothetical protein [Rossellomorea sp. SC111]
MVKKISILIVIFFLSGCTSLEEKVSTFTEAEIDEVYGEKVKMTSIEESTPIGATIIVVLTKIFTDVYDLTFQSEDDPNFTFGGEISGDLENFEEDYVQSKHEYLLERDKKYEEYQKVFEENGIVDVQFRSMIYKGKPYITISGYYQGGETNPEKLVHTIGEISERLVKVPVETSLDLEMEYNRISTDYYSKEESDEFQQIIEQQFMLIHHHELVDSGALEQELEKLDMFADSSLNWDEKSEHFITTLFVNQDITLFAKPYSSNEDILKAFDIFKKYGMDESVVNIIDLDGTCKVKEVKETEDLSRCYRER